MHTRENGDNCYSNNYQKLFSTNVKNVEATLQSVGMTSGTKNLPSHW